MEAVPDMAEPEFDRSNGWWFIRYRTGGGTREKKTLKKDPRWTKGGDWPPGEGRPKCPADVIVMARPFQDLDMAAKLGHEVKLPKSTDLAGFLASYRNSYALSQQPNSIRLLDYAISCFLPFCVAAKVTTVQQVNKPTCREFMEHLRTLGRARNTIKSVKGLIGGAFERAVGDGLIVANPCHKLAVPGRDDATPTPSWTQEEIDALTPALRGWHRDMFVVGINCGFRREALCNLEWRDVKFKIPRRVHGTLACRKEFSKNGRAYSVPLFDPLREVLQRRKEASADPGDRGKIFPGEVPGEGVDPSSFRRALERACSRAGIEYKGHAWHSMRATFATLCHARGVNPRTIQAWMNHSSIQMTDKYSHYSSESDDTEAAKME